MAIKKLPNDDQTDIEDDPSPPQANSAVRAETLRKACRQITDLDAKRKSISAEMAEVKQTLIKGDLGMKIADFALALRVYQLEGEDRDTLFDTLRETFDALGVGEQLGFLDALQPGADGPGAYDA